jgi:hypothetical protein
VIEPDLASPSGFVAVATTEIAAWPPQHFTVGVLDWRGSWSSPDWMVDDEC